MVLQEMLQGCKSMVLQSSYKQDVQIDTNNRQNKFSLQDSGKQYN